MEASRRRFISYGLCSCMLGFLGRAARAGQPHSSSLAPSGDLPQDADEQGLWTLCERLERDVAASSSLVRDEPINRYLRAVTDRLLGKHAARVRIYLVRNPDFNASMAPNGMLIVHTGLLARLHDEAQLAAILGHESAHYLQRHSIQRWREIRNLSAVMATVQMGGSVMGGTSGERWYEIAHAINEGLLFSFFSYSRDMETEADSVGLTLLHDAGYDPHAPSRVWARLIEERKASAAARSTAYVDRSLSALSTHPPNDARMAALEAAAMKIESRDVSSSSRMSGRDEYREAVAPLRPVLLEEQIKLNDPGASLYLLESLALDGWDGLLRYYAGEVYRLRGSAGDSERAAVEYALAVELVDAPAEAHRAHGYALMKSGAHDAARRALRRYIELRPDAPDVAIVQFTIEQL